jgi:ORF6N domain
MKGNPPIESLILTIRGQRVILAADLAALYGVETKVLNQAVKRNFERFPQDFSFQLHPDEFAEIKAQGIVTSDGRVALRSQIVTLNTPPLAAKIKPLKRGRHIKYPPYGFTEHGAIMAANVLNSPEAVSMSVYVVRAFVQMRERLAANAAIIKRLAEIDKSLLDHDQTLRIIWQKLQPLLQPPPEPPRRRIGFQAENKA